MNVVTPIAIAEAMKKHQVAKSNHPSKIDKPEKVKAPEVNDEIVDKIIGNQAGIVRPKVECAVCGKMISENNFSRHSKIHADGYKPEYPRTDCRHCGRSIGNNNIKRHEEFCDVGKDSLENALNAIADAVGGINASNIDDFIKVRKIVQRMMK